MYETIKINTNEFVSLNCNSANLINFRGNKAFGMDDKLVVRFKKFNGELCEINIPVLMFCSRTDLDMTICPIRMFLIGTDITIKLESTEVSDATVFYHNIENVVKIIN